MPTFSYATSSMAAPEPPHGPQVSSGPNLVPAPLHQGDEALSISPTAGSHVTAPVSAAGAYISFSVQNTGSDPVTTRFYTDLYVDGIFVNRWDSVSIPSGQFMVVRDWEELPQRIHLAPGQHTLRLLVDSMNTVTETNESDNVIARTFQWEGSPASTPVPTKKPDLVVVPPRRGGAPLIVSPFRSATRNSNVVEGGPVYVSWSIRDASVVGVSKDIAVQLYLDGTLVDDRLVHGLLAEGRSALRDWDQLPSKLDLTQGTHTLRVVVDPGNLVDESNELNNAFDVTFQVLPAGSMIQPPQPQASSTPQPALKIPTPPSKPDLAPTVPQGWDAAVVAKSYNADGEAAQGFDGPLSVDDNAYISFAVWNASPVGTDATWVVDVSVDGRDLGETRFTGSASDGGQLGSATVEVPAGTLTPGWHTVILRIDPDRQIDEASRANDICQRSFDWGTGSVPTAPPAATPLFSEGQVQALLRPVDRILSDVNDLGGPDAGASSTLRDVESVALGAYQLMTGKVLSDERFAINFARRDEYLVLATQACMYHSESLDAQVYQASLRQCQSDVATSAGFTTQAYGKIQVFVDTNAPPATVTATLFHELGHALAQSLANRKSTSEGQGANTAVNALAEAEAQTFEAATWRTVGEFIGESLTSYPDTALMQKEVKRRIGDVINNASAGEIHAIGYEIMWMTALTDPGRQGLRADLMNHGSLSGADAIRMYNYFLSLKPEDVPSWESTLLANGILHFDEYRQDALERLVPNLDPAQDGNPSLYDAAFLAP